MSWGTELWDQFDNVAIHTQKGLEFCEKYAHFIKERCAIEKEYASKLKKLVKNYQPKKKEEEEYQFTYARSFLDNVKEIHDLAGQHEAIAENLNTQIVLQIQNLLQELKQERKRYLQDGAKQMNSLQTQLGTLERSKKQYEKAFKDSEKAQEAYKKADADINLSRAEVEKAKTIQITKSQYCEDCKNEYASELQKTNDGQRDHYNTRMPATFQQLQTMEEGRIGKIQEYIRKSAEIERNVIPIINTCIDGMVRAADSVNAPKDSQLVIERHKSGLQPPGDIPFEDLSGGIPSSDNHNHRGSTPKVNTLRGENHKGTVTSKSKKRGGILGGIFGSSKTDDTKEDYSHLPPNQQKRKLNQKIDTLRNNVAKETAERDGMLKMRDVYVQNPALGDASSLDKQLAENAQKLDKLRQELSKYEAYLVEADNRLTGQHGHSYSDESITRTMSDVSVSSSQPSTPQQQHLSSANESPDSGVENRGSFTTENHKEDSFDDDLEELPIIGKCKALYGFDGQNESSISMGEGEELSILEEDMNDGWTRVRRTATGEEGYVPTSYVEVHIFGK